MRLRITSDGTARGTKIVNEDTGLTLNHVVKLTLTIKPGAPTEAEFVTLMPAIAVNMLTELMSVEAVSNDEYAALLWRAEG